MISTTISSLDRQAITDLITRLKSIEGQARGIQRMFEEDRTCQSLINQFMALRAASHAATMECLQIFALHCLQESDNPEEAMQHIVALMAKLTR
jgi:CsoR family transcriptional regulator, copper-sensing transcriptional repressor